MKRLHLCVVCLLGLAFAPHESRAAAMTVSVDSITTGDELLQEAATRLRAELATGGFAVTDEHNPIVLGQITLSRDVATSAVNIHLVDHASNKTVDRQIRADPHTTATVIAIRAVELLRASLLEIARPSNESAANGKSTPNREDIEALVGMVVQPVPKPFSNTTISAGTLWLWGRGLNSSGVWGAQFSLALPVRTQWSLALTGVTTLSDQQIQDQNGLARLDQYVGALSLQWHGRKNDRVTFYAEGGVGMHLLRANGAGTSPATGHQDSASSVLFTAGAGATVRASRRVYLGLQLGAWAFPRPVVVRLAGTERERTSFLTLVSCVFVAVPL